ncbi:MAG TPA: CAP domain-containing protein [Xanthobacteraceae bacterium]
MTCRRTFAPRAACLIAVLALAGLGGCAADLPPPAGEPSMYVSMATAEAELDAPAAASMISGYRANNGLSAVSLDPELMKLADTQARAMAAHDKMDHNVIRDFGERLKIAGYKSTVAAENIGAGYHTLAEAFSGWRDSPPHRQNMLLSGASRIGIAAAYSPKSKYRVFWALILAG